MITTTVNPHEDFNTVVQKFYRYTARVKTIVECNFYFINKKK